MRHEAKLTSKGQLTLPVKLRETLGLKPGDKVVFVEDEQGRIALEARTGRLADLRGVVRMEGRASIDAWVNDARAARADRALGKPDRPRSRRQ